MLKIHQPDTFLDVEDTEHHIYIVNFAKLFEINIQFPLLVDIKKYNCDKKITKDTKALFYHHIIHELCRYILKISQNKGHKIVIYYNSLDLKKLTLTDSMFHAIAAMSKNPEAMASAIVKSMNKSFEELIKALKELAAANTPPGGNGNNGPPVIPANETEAEKAIRIAKEKIEYLKSIN